MKAKITKLLMFLLLSSLIFSMAKVSVYANEMPTASIEESSAEETTKQEESSAEETTTAQKLKITDKKITKIANQTYTGKEIKPQVKISGLKEGRDFTVTYKNNKNVGTATVTVTGKGNYTGKLTTTFKITAKNLKGKKITKIADQIYKGKKVEPTVKITGLKNGTDYKVTYKNNKAIGKATVTVTGKGNYTGKLTTTFKIVPNTVKNAKVTRTSTSAVLKWSKVTGAKGYTVYTYNPSTKKYKEYTSTSKTSLTIKKLSASKDYYYAVKAYGGAYRSASYSNRAKASKLPSTVVAKSLERTSSSSITITWKKVSGATGYEIDYATQSNFKNAKTVKVSKYTTSKVLKKISASKTYYVRVRAIKTSGDNTTYGKYSTAKVLKPSGYNSVYASYATRYSRSTTYDRTREVNLRLACNSINGTVLKPGQTFSFNQVVGERTAARGYKPGHIFASGSTVSAIGGGICQVASTMFNAALMSNFRIDQRSQHSKRVAYVPLGRDAAIYWGSKDFKFTNTSNTNIKILASAKNGVISVKFMAYGNGSEKPPKVSLSVSRSGNTFTLRRSVGGKVNYTTRSTY